MKKIVFVIMLLTLTFFIASCREDVKNLESKPHIYPRTEDISAGIENDGEEFEYAVDFDFDGKKDEVEIDFDILNEDAWVYEMEVSVGDYEVSIDVDGRCIEAVYVCDIDEDDGVRDLVVITNEMSDDPVVRIMKYDSGLPQYNFVSDYDGKPYKQKGIGYAVSYYFNVNEDDSITMEEQTPSAGMWSVYKTYYRNNNGYFVEKKPEYYEVLPDFMEKNPFLFADMTEEETEKWKNGYVMAHVDYTSNGFTVYKGEYFKVLYDDGNNNIYVEKENGESAWISVDYNMERYDFNKYFFFLAG